jgi:hypothetical protein
VAAFDASTASPGKARHPGRRVRPANGPSVGYEYAETANLMGGFPPAGAGGLKSRRLGLDVWQRLWFHALRSTCDRRCIRAPRT